jgi:hypothetical protein
MADPRGRDKVRREYLQRVLDQRTDLTDEQIKYAQWYIHSDQMFENLSGYDGTNPGSGVGLSTYEALDYMKNAQYNWQWLEKAGLTKGFGSTAEGAVQLFGEYKAAQKTAEKESFARYNRWSQLKPNESDIGPAVETTGKAILVAVAIYATGGGAAGTIGGGESLALSGGGVLSTASAVSVSGGLAAAGGLTVVATSGSGAGGDRLNAAQQQRLRDLAKRTRKNIDEMKGKIGKVQDPLKKEEFEQQLETFERILKQVEDALKTLDQ